MIIAEFTFPPMKPVDNGLDLAVDDFSAGKPLTVRGRIRWPTDMQLGVNGFPFATVVLVGKESRFIDGVDTPWEEIGDLEITGVTLADPVTAAGTALFSHELEPRDEFARYKLAISVLDAGGNEVCAFRRANYPLGALRSRRGDAPRRGTRAAGSPSGRRWGRLLLFTSD